jgi:hypothetical protein
MAQVYVDSVARDPDYLRMEMHCVLEGAKATQLFFDARWKSFSDYIEVSLKELAVDGKVSAINPAIASLMFQGMIREALYAKCIYHSENYKTIPLTALVNQLVGLFLRAIEYECLNE